MKNLKSSYLLLIIGFVALPFLVEAIPMLGPTWVRILGFAMLYVLLALGLNIVVATPACWTWATSVSMPLAPICMPCSRRLICTWRG